MYRVQIKHCFIIKLQLIAINLVRGIKITQLESTEHDYESLGGGWESNYLILIYNLLS